MAVTHTKMKGKNRPRKLIVSCVELCGADLEVPITGDEQFLARYFWKHGEWLLTVRKAVVESTTDDIVLQPICKACQEKCIDAELLREGREAMRMRYDGN